MIQREECDCCFGHGKIRETEWLDGDEHACMTCLGKGYFEWDDEAVGPDNLPPRTKEAS